MVDYRVTFKGDLGNLAQFDAAIRNSVAQNTAAISQANKSLLSTIGNVNGLYTPDAGAGLFYKNLRTEIDATNRTFVQSGQVVRRVVADYQLAYDKQSKVFSIVPKPEDVYESPYKKRIGDLDAYEDALNRTAPLEQKILQDRQKTLAKTIPYEERLIAIGNERAAAEAKIKQQYTQNRLLESPLQARLTQLQQQRATIDPADTAAIRATDREIRQVTRDLKEAQRAGSQALKPLLNDLNAINHEADVVGRKIDRLVNNQAGRAAGIRTAQPYQDLHAAAVATPPIQRDLQSALNLSKDFQKRLLSLGLGGGISPTDTEGFKKALATQEAALTRYTENARTGVKTIQGSFRDNIGTGATGILKQFTIELDKNGKEINRLGGTYAGAGSFLRQTVRDFQKVIEWTVATTLVFGSLAAVVKQLGSINELNTSLARLAITAQTSAEDTRGLFNDLAQVAISTATPLNDIVKAADDIALATKEAGDSTDEWKAKIVDLTRAVGIFTNLTGTDTVQATDQLSAAFKQLNVAPADLVGILSKVTAVAGGQSLAINDIVKGLSGLAEAAKAAGLSVDEQIASIQVLSQVTNKTSDEVATSFKNLFGAVSSVGSEKVLKQFGIEIRDSTGGLRDFLDIYRDIRKALDEGVIPQNRLPDVLRGIAGGPRRAPDAAALLANLGRIDEVVGKSIGATNEALIANARILDTNAAKITQFQNAVNIAFFQTFGKAVEDLVAAFTDAGTAIATVIGHLDPNLVNLALKLGLVLIAFKTLGAGLRLVGIDKLLGSSLQGLVGLTRGLTTAGEAATTAGRQLTLFSAQEVAASRAGGFLSGLKNNKGLLLGLGIAGAGAAVGAATKGGGLDTNTIGTLLQVGGSIAALIPGLQAVGIGALAAGTAMQVFAGDSTKAGDSAQKVAQDIYTLTQTLKDQQQEANNFVKAQADAKTTIDELSIKTKKTADEQARLLSATNAYADATLNLVDANRQVAKSFDDIIAKLPGLSDKYKAFREANYQHIIPDEDLKKLQEQLARQILQGTGQAIYDTTFGSISSEFRPGRNEPAASGSIVNVNTDPNYKLYSQAAQAGGFQKFDLSNLLNDPTKLNQLFNKEGGTNQEVIDALRDGVNQGFAESALAQLPDLIAKGQAGGIDQERYQVLAKAIQDIVDSSNQFASNTAVLAQQTAVIQSKVALGIFNQTQAQNATQDVGIAQGINQAAQQYKPPSYTTDSGVKVVDNTNLEQAQKLIAEFSQNAEQGIGAANQQLIQAGKLVLILSGTFNQLADVGEDAVNRGIYDTLKKAGVAGDQLDQIAKILGQDLSAAAATVEDLSASFDKARASAAQAFAGRALQLQIAKNSGEFEKNAKGLAILTEQNQQALDSNNALIDSIESLSTGAMVDLNQALSNITGLQGQYFTQTELNTDTTEQFTEKVLDTTNKLIENAVAAGVNADGIRKIQLEVVKLIGVISAIPTYKKVVIDVQQRLSYTGYAPGGFNAIQQELDQAKADDAANTKAQQDAVKQIQNLINKLLGGGKGGSLGKPPTSGRTRAAGAGATGPDVSQIDLPEEIANAANRSALIQEAIRRARELQKTIPGATKEASNDIVSLLKGTQNILNVRGIKDDLLRRALEELADIEKKRLEFETKADTIRRIRIGAGDFSAIANVPLNTKTGISLGGPSGPINVTLNVNGQILTPAQLQQLADLIASTLKKQIANG